LASLIADELEGKEAVLEGEEVGCPINAKGIWGRKIARGKEETTCVTYLLHVKGGLEKLLLR